MKNARTSNLKLIRKKESELPKDITQPDQIKSEVNFLIYPLGSLDKKYIGNTITYREIIRQNNQQFEIIWKVVGSEEYGVPGPSAIETSWVIDKMINDEWNRTGTVPVYIKTTYYQIAKMRNLSWNKMISKQIQKDLRQLAFTGIDSVRTFKCKWDNKHLETMFHKYDAIVLKGKTIPLEIQRIQGDSLSKAECVYVLLGSYYRQSLENFYTKQIDYGYLMSLPNVLTKRLYQLLNFAFATRLEGESIQYSYTELSQRLPVKQQRYLSIGKAILNPHFDKLIESGYITKYEWGEKERERYITFWIGEIARMELRAKLDQTPLLFELPAADEGNETLNYFFIQGKIERKSTQKELDQVRILEQEFGQEKSKGLIDFALSEAERTGFKIQFFGAVLLYKEKYLNWLDKKDKTKKVLEVQSKREKTEQTRTKKERETEQKLVDYFDSLDTATQTQLRVRAEQIQQEKYGESIVIGLGELSTKYALLDAIEEYKERLKK